MWTDMHLTANRAMLEHLKKGGLLKGDVEEMIKVSFKMDSLATAVSIHNLDPSCHQVVIQNCYFEIRTVFSGL